MEELDTVLELHKEKKIDWFLRFRIATMAVVAFVFGATVVRDIVTYHANPWPVLWFVPLGFCAGYFWFYRMTAIHWDEETKSMKIKRFDSVGVIVLMLYGISRLLLKFVLEAEISSVIGVSVATYSVVFGLVVGRMFGLFRVMHRLHSENAKPIEKK